MEGYWLNADRLPNLWEDASRHLRSNLDIFCVQPMNRSFLTFAIASCLFTLTMTSAHAADFLSNSERFTPNGVIEGGTETGELNGVFYRFHHSDGSGRVAGKEGNNGSLNESYFSNWSLSCEKDAMTDKKRCSMQLNDLWIYVYANGKSIVSIGSEHFPGSSVAIRIDGGTPIKASGDNDGDYSPATSAKIIAQLKKAKTITTRFMKWPYQHWVDQSWDLYGFPEAYQYITWAVKRGR